MRDEALIHFHYGRHISAGVHLHTNGGAAPELISEAAPYLDPKVPGRCVVGFCAAHPATVDDVTNAPPPGWETWTFREWDDWFGRINGVFLVDLAQLQVTQYPLYSCSPHIVRCDLSNLPGRLAAVADWLPA
ncbi:hypothetical protein QMT40_000718 [Parvibaculaceae bacterium PLY_AMNH_Bact1]|nr:hypothetical protein QMT40_000718 [Parvibaculaceae bacterium PLY_AMNH_Bact1]